MCNRLTIRRAFFVAVALLFQGSPRVLAQSDLWHQLTTDHFEIFYQGAFVNRVDRVVLEAERAYGRISADLRSDLSARVPLLLFSTIGDLPNSDRARSEVFRKSGAPDRDHLLLPLAPVDQREGLLTHELTHLFEFEIVPRSPRLPPWVYEGLAEYERARWTLSARSSVQAAAVVPSLSQLTSADRDWGHAVFDFIGDEYGIEGIRRYLSVLNEPTVNANVLQEVFRLTSDEFDRKFERYVKARTAGR
jgi:hypothetical protein